jgi:hypothetical protein
MTIAMASERVRTDVSLLRFTEFFDGDAIAWGVFLDRFGVVRQNLTVQLHGAWHGSTFQLDEVFEYGTGERETRQWLVRDIDNASFSATCADCIGPIAGLNGGDSVSMTYDYNLHMGGRRMSVSFDDRMYRLGPTRLFNRAAMRKFGVVLGHVTLFIEKQSSKAKGASS